MHTNAGTTWSQTTAISGPRTMSSSATEGLCLLKHTTEQPLRLVLSKLQLQTDTCKPTCDCVLCSDNMLAAGLSMHLDIP